MVTETDPAAAVPARSSKSGAVKRQADTAIEQLKGDAADNPREADIFTSSKKNGKKMSPGAATAKVALEMAKAASTAVAETMKETDEAMAARVAFPNIVAKAATVTSMDFDGSWRAGGEYEIRYMLTEAGHFHLHIWCDVDGDGERRRLPGSPFEVYVSHAQPASNASVLIHSTRSSYTAGDNIELVSQLMDKFGNVCSIPEGFKDAMNFSRLQSPASYIMQEVFSQHGEQAKRALKKFAKNVHAYRQDGNWPDLSSHEVLPKKPQSTPELFERPAVPSTMAFSIAPREKRRGSIGRSPNSHSRYVANALVAWLVTPKGNVPLVLRKTEVLGRYEVADYQLTLTGDYEAHVTWSGAPIKGSPCRFKVHSAAASSKHSYVTSPGTPAVANLPCELTLHTIDKFGNRLTNGGARVDIRAIGASAQCSVIDHKNGTYNLHFTVNSAGSYQIDVRIDGSRVKAATV